MRIARRHVRSVGELAAVKRLGRRLGLLGLGAGLVLAPPTDGATQPRSEVRPTDAERDAIREVVTRYVIETFEPPCRNHWDRATYCLEFEDGQQPSPEFLKRLRGIAPGLHSVAYCKDALDMDGQTIHPFIRVQSVTLRGRDEAQVDVVAFCSHGNPTVKRVAGRWKYSGSIGGWVGCGPVPADCVGDGIRPKRTKTRGTRRLP